MTLRWGGVLLVAALAGCEKAPDGGWGPVSEASAADGLGKAEVLVLRVAPQGQSLRVPLTGGGEMVQPVPDAAGRGLTLDGVGAYPAARFGEVVVRVPQPGRTDGARLLVVMTFAVPASAEEVIGWYQRQFGARGVPVQRDGLVLNGQTRAGDDWTLMMRPGDGGSVGELRLRRS